MDEDQNIYDMKLNKVGEAGDSDEEATWYFKPCATCIIY